MNNWNSIQRIDSPTGASLAVHAQAADSNPKAIIHINHGMAEHAARYERFANALSAAGYHVIAHDHRGHGQTTAPDAPLGLFSNSDGVEKVLADCKAVNQHARTKWTGLPVIWFGHSMGGIIGTLYCIRHGDTLDGAILWNFNVDGGVLVTALRTMLKIARAMKGSDVPSMLANKLTFEDWNRKFKPNRTGFDWLSRDEAEVDKYVADPLCGFPCTNGLWLDVTAMVQAGADNLELAKIRNDLPVNLLGGGADPSTNGGAATKNLAERMKKTGMSDVTLTVTPGARHETLNEINREEATADLIKWLDRRWG